MIVLTAAGRSGAEIASMDGIAPEVDLPTPLEFSTLLAHFLSAARAETPDYVELEALRMKLIGSYERAFEAR